MLLPSFALLLRRGFSFVLLSGIDLLTVSLGACSKAPCAQATPGSYASKGFLFVDYPDGGAVYQIRFFPTCQMDTAHFLRSLVRRLNPGINFGILGPTYKQALRTGVHQLQAQRPDGRTEQLHVWPVCVKYSQAKDLTLPTTGEKTMRMDYLLNGNPLRADYFFTGRVEIDTLIFLPYHP